MWASVINREPDTFGKHPQIYIIASGSGLEIGFSVAIHEKDYYNLTIKHKNREIVPTLYNKRPDPNGEFVKSLDGALLEEGDWQFGVKTRKGPEVGFSSLSDLIKFLKSPESSVRGGGSIYKIVEPGEIKSGSFNLDSDFSQAVSLFAPLMTILTPSVSEQKRLSDFEFMRDAAGKLPEFEPQNLEDGRRKILGSVVVRQGQAKFREKLIDAYDARCAITDTPILATLQAAHIVPYKGPETNSVQNGLLLRADIHNLFDLGLIQVNPDTSEIEISDELKATCYSELQGRKLRTPKAESQMPSRQALALRLQFVS